MEPKRGLRANGVSSTMARGAAKLPQFQSPLSQRVERLIEIGQKDPIANGWKNHLWGPLSMALQEKHKGCKELAGGCISWFTPSRSASISTKQRTYVLPKQSLTCCLMAGKKVVKVVMLETRGTMPGNGEAYQEEPVTSSREQPSTRFQ